MEELEFVDLITVNIPSKSFLIIGSNGSTQEVKCENSSEFIARFKLLKECIDEDDIIYIGLD